MSDFKTPLELLESELEHLKKIQKETNFEERKTKANTLINEYSSLIDSIKENNVIKSISDNVIEEILIITDEYSRDYNHYEYGLPLHDVDNLIKRIKNYY